MADADLSYLTPKSFRQRKANRKGPAQTKFITILRTITRPISRSRWRTVGGWDPQIWYAGRQARLLFYGFPGSRIGRPTFDPDDHAARLNARIIAVDRPGYGLSDAKRGRTFLDWSDDVVELADALALDQFSILYNHLEEILSGLVPSGVNTTT